jgi:hypothetical protein
MGRAPEIVNISSKPTPEGFYIYQGGRLSKTQALVLDLLTQRDSDTNEPLYPPGVTLFGSIT